MSSNATTSSSVYNFTLGDWTWGATDPSENQEVKLNTPCLGYHPAANTNEDNVLLCLDQSYDDHRDVVPLPGKMEYPPFSEVGIVANSMVELTDHLFLDQLQDCSGYARWLSGVDLALLTYCLGLC